MAWVYLILAGLFEMTGVMMINRFHEQKNKSSFTMMLLAFTASFLFLAIAMLDLPMGTAYAIWTGIGASGGAIIGMLLYNEPKNWKRILFIFMILGSAVGLKLVS
ncbi:DMT family transporter [Bacillus massiliigorillae]|uniref:DMT family transporter n=1 Tax=Bacillus massiliigorillae TaxID=1243664 RepID=UPI0003A574EF|nr:multidrug efflux SMR transporter [Bacillus massiliigorillae]